ncbi:hypothetical protein HMPREF3190_00851 [Umbribacter vaginalis]|nr:hypothetical protein HMPREF3190_00851 [Coriobacteriales bacterium DNF00809]
MSLYLKRNAHAQRERVCAVLATVLACGLTGERGGAGTHESSAGCCLKRLKKCSLAGTHESWRGRWRDCGNRNTREQLYTFPKIMIICNVSQIFINFVRTCCCGLRSRGVRGTGKHATRTNLRSRSYRWISLRYITSYLSSTQELACLLQQDLLSASLPL